MGTNGYTLIDLPHANVIQGYYLLKVLPSERVVLYGEPGWVEAVDRVRVLPAHAVRELRGHQFDLVLNQDSFPEMHADTVDAYLSWIAGVCADGLLLSVNHESKAPYGDFQDIRRTLAHVCVADADRAGRMVFVVFSARPTGCGVGT